MTLIAAPEGGPHLKTGTQEGGGQMRDVQYAEIPYVGKKVSRIFYGTAAPPFLQGGDGGELLDAVLETGINTLDMARNYGKTENSVGRWLREKGRRDEVVLLSKCCHPTALWRKRVTGKAIREDFEKTTEALGTDYIDIYLLHRDDPERAVDDLVETFNAMHAEGKIGAFGGSNWSVRRIEEANEYAYAHGLIPFSVSSPNFGLADQVRDPWGGGCETISGPSHEKDREWYAKNQMPVIAYSSLGRGLFSGKLKSQDQENKRQVSKVLDEAARKGYASPENFERLRRSEILAERLGVSVPEIAMAWIFSQPLNTFAVVSSSKISRMEENIEASNLTLTEEMCAYLDLKRRDLDF